MVISYQRLAVLVKKNIQEGVCNKKIVTLFHSMENKTFNNNSFKSKTFKSKNLSEKFARRFLYKIQTQSRQINQKQKFLTKKTWKELYEKLHCLGKNKQLTNVSFFDKYLTSLKEDKKNITKFCTATRNYILLNLWFAKKNNFSNLQQNYQFLAKTLPRANYQFKKMKPIFLWKKRFLKATYCFHHGLGSLEPKKFQEFILGYLKGQKIITRLLIDKKFICFFRATDSYLANYAKGIFIDLQLLLQEVMQKYFPHHTQPPLICWSKTFSCKKLAAYSFLEDKIYVSEIFDFPHKNLEILYYLIFHEILHKDIGVKYKGNKIYTHTREFKAKERAYPNFLEVQQELENYASMKEC